MARNGMMAARGQRLRRLGGPSSKARGTGEAPPAWILLPLHPDRLFIAETDVSCHCDPGVASVYGSKPKTPSVSGVAGATRTPTPTKTMPSAITGPLPLARERRASCRVSLVECRRTADPSFRELRPTARNFETTEQSVVLVVRSRREVELVRVAGRTAAPEQQLPKAVERECVAGCILEKTLRVSRAAVEGHDVPAPEVSHQQRATESPEAPRGKRHAPGRVEDGQLAARRRARREPPEETTLGVEDVDEPVA